MWSIFNSIAVNWLLIFLPAMLLWFIVRALVKKLRPRMSGRALLGAFGLWLVSGLCFFNMGPPDPNNVTGMAMFKLYSLTGILSVAAFVFSFKRPKEQHDEPLKEL